MLLSSLSTFAALLVASVSGAVIEGRQSQTWRDPYIKQPINFKVSHINKCNYQLTFRRDTFDSRYVLGFDVRYSANGARRSVNPVNPGNLAISPRGRNLPTYLYRLDGERDLAVHQFANVCSSGASGNEPQSFRVFFDLDEGGYTYRNDWYSPQITISSGAVPAVPANVRTSKASNGDITVTWSAVSGATGYFVLIDGLYDNSEVGDIRVLWTNLEGASATSSFIPARRRTRRIAVLARGADGVVSPSASVPDVRP